jgi:DUF4097 and DUF4098 domain-containing protein YvlB
MANLKNVYIIGFLLLVSCDVNINKDFKIEDHATVKNDLITVNGGIYVGAHCIVEGDLSTVNGPVELKNNTQVKASIQTVNGAVTIYDNVKVSGNISTLNGEIDITNSEIVGSISNISGDIQLVHVKSDGDVSTNFGDITVRSNSTISGSIRISDNDEIPEKLRNVKITIRDSSIVQGDLINENREVIVLVFIEEGSSINGEIIDADKVDSLQDLDIE